MLVSHRCPHCGNDVGIGDLFMTEEYENCDVDVYPNYDMVVTQRFRCPSCKNRFSVEYKGIITSVKIEE